MIPHITYFWEKCMWNYIKSNFLILILSGENGWSSCSLWRGRAAAGPSGHRRAASTVAEAAVMEASIAVAVEAAVLIAGAVVMVALIAVEVVTVGLTVAVVVMEADRI